MKQGDQIPSPLWGGLGRGLSRQAQSLVVGYSRFVEKNVCFATPSLTLPTGGRGLLSCLIFLFCITNAFAADDIDNTSHLPLPRFASLRSGEVNLRTGPGTRYPIEWVYTRRGLPVEVVAEYDIWRRVRDPEGSEGWVNKTELTGKRQAIITGGVRELRSGHDDQAGIVAYLEVGTIGQLVSCSQEWCKLKFDSVKGYLRRSDFWGAYPTETFD